ncbi:MAG: hypothetical protein AB1578_20605 [Thermodesulfobacteriota bacterium]
MSQARLFDDSCRSAGRFSRRGLAAAALLAFGAAALAGGQAASIVLTGEEVCLGEGCAVVGRLTRISPALFNLLGAGVFAAAGMLALWARGSRTPTLPLTLLQLLLGGALAAEGVLFAYQWQVARAWCIYCLVILGAVAALNLLLGLRQAARAVAGFGAAAAIFSLLTFLPARATLADGTLAVRPGTDPDGGAQLVLLFSEHCPHCATVVAALQAKDRCTLYLNPVTELPATYWPELSRRPAYDPAVNAATARLLGLETIPILIAREAGGQRVLTGASQILQYVEEACGEPAPAAPSLLLSPWGGGSLLDPAEDGCGLNLECE